LGALLNALEVHGEADRTLVWVISDHGESLGEHGEPMHSIFVYDCTMRVVSVLRPPPADGHYRSGRPRMHIGTQTGLISVAPTLLHLAGLADNALEGEGRSLVPLMRGESVSEEPLYCETLSPMISYHWSPLYAVRTSEWKYIRAPEPELYNLQADPREERNLVEVHPEEVGPLEAALEAFLSGDDGGAGARAGDTDARRMPTPEERERLRSLGYLSAGATPRSAADELPDPKQMIRSFDAQYKRAKSLLHGGRFEEAIEALEQALRVDPLNNSLYLYMANALRGAGRTVEAGRAYREALRIQPHSPRAWYGWGQALLQADSPDSAVWAFEESIDLLPASPDPWMGRAGARWLQGRYAEAAADFDSALACGGDPILLHGLLAKLFREELSRPVEAERHLAVYARLRKMSVAEAAKRLPTLR